MKYLKNKIRKFFINNYRKNKTFILYLFRWDIFALMHSGMQRGWFIKFFPHRLFYLLTHRPEFRKKLTNDFGEIVQELKDGKTDRFDFTIHGGGNSHQRRKMKRAIIKNIVDNFYKYR